MAKSITRAQALGVSPAKLKRHAIAKLKAIRANIEWLCIKWNDVDNAVELAAEELLERVQDLETTISESLALLEEPDERDA
jgi:hypothetical protein